MEKEDRKEKMERCMGILLIAAAFFLAAKAGQIKQVGLKLVGSGQAKKAQVVVIDAGHGGDDPGKIGVNKALEKDVNLAIAKKVKVCLEKKAIHVVMTRSDEHGLYDENTKNHKVQDMQRRCGKIDEAKPDAAVSIHQNSYSAESVKGAQVFYYGQSGDGKKLAESIQKQMADTLGGENHRQAKANESYYLLKKTSVPTVIVECGFLSNWEEAKLLVTEEYQDKVAKAVCEGILKYLKEENGTEKEDV